MGRRDEWYSKIKKVLNPGSKPTRINAKSKTWSRSESGSKRFENRNHLSQVIPPVEYVPVCHLSQSEQVGLAETRNDQNKVQLRQLSETATALAPKITSAIMRHIPVIVARPVRKSTKEDTAATQIQTAYRGYLARRTLRALRGLVRLKFIVQGQSVKRQATNTLQCMQALARVQSQVRSRAQMSNENQALQKQLLLKHSKKHTPFRNSDDWKDCAQSKQRDEEKMKKKHEAALRRERTLAYSSAHQQTWKSSPKRTSNMTATDTNHPNWGWSWLERWMADRGQNGTDASLNSRPETADAGATKEACHLYKPPTSIKLTPKPPPIPALKITSAGERNKPGSTRTRLSNACSDSSEKTRRHSFAGSPAREYEISVGSNSPKRSHTMPAKLVNTRQRLQSPLGMEHNRTQRKSSSVRLTEKSPSHLVPHSSPRRHSAPPKVKNTSVTQQSQNITAEIS